jgi:hypothetical protein
LAQPLLLAPRQLLGPDIERKITSGIEPILPLIDIGPQYLRNRGASAAQKPMPKADIGQAWLIDKPR